jgi:RNA polymerase sigma-70 factor (ECF subfamily)
VLPGRAAREHGRRAGAPAQRIRELLEQAVGRLRLLCATFLHKSYPRLTRPHVNLETDELLGGVAGGLIKALQTARHTTVRRFFALANQHLRWQLNDLARRLDQQPAAANVATVGTSRGSSCSTRGRAAAPPCRGKYDIL